MPCAALILALTLMGCRANAPPEQPSPIPAGSAHESEPASARSADTPASTTSSPPPAGSAASGTSAFDHLVRILAPIAAAGESRRARLTAYEERAGEVRIECEAASAADMSLFVKRLAKEGPYKDVRIEQTEAGGGDAPLFRARLRAQARDARVVLVLRSAEDAEQVLPPNAQNPFAPLVLTTPAAEAEQTRRLGELTLIAIVAGPPPRAMFADATKMGWVGREGDRIGPTGCRYRLEKIEPKAARFVGMDRHDCAGEPATRVLMLR